MLGPCRYALMTGDVFPVFLRDAVPPEGLLEHWSKTVPGSVMPKFVSTIKSDDLVYAYLPVEQIQKHLNDPVIHYHLAGKDSIVLMTQKTTKLLPDTRVSRPCVVKTTHSMGSKGIFIIRNDEDEYRFQKYLLESGKPTFVVTDFVDIARNVACHFFMHPNGTSLTWFGSNENKRLLDGTFSSDSYLDMNDQEELKRMQLPFVEEVVQYCHSLGFWGFCGIDILFDSTGLGYLVDINPRVTGSCPALMTLHRFHKQYGFQVGIFRRSGNIYFHGCSNDLFEKVEAYNSDHEGVRRVVIHSLVQSDTKDGSHVVCRVNIGVYGNVIDKCREVLNRFAHPLKVG
jgi:ATP-grasp domain